MRPAGRVGHPASMVTLEEQDRDRLRDGSFAYVDRSGERHLPIHDAAHVRNAMSRFSQTDFDGDTSKRGAARNILRAAKRHGIEVAPDDAVAKAARG